jgi:uncharacterized membrane protein YraQ (UPF0718 family)
MISALITAFLFSLAGGLMFLAWRRRDGTARLAVNKTIRELLWIAPRLALGVLGAGFLAALMPEEVVAAHLGGGSGVAGVTIATVLGAITPGGPVVGFSIAFAALKAGAGVAQVVAYVVAWSLVSLNRVVIWEAPILEPRFVWLRVLVSLPLPILAGGIVLMAGIS